MDEIETKVRNETDQLLLCGSQAVATTFVLGTILGTTVDFALGQGFDHPYRRAVEMSGLVVMLLAIWLARSDQRLASPRQIAVGTAVAGSLFLLFVMGDAGPEAEKATLLAYTVLNLGVATLLPWGMWGQAAFLGVSLVSIATRLYLLTGSPLFDRGVSVAMVAGLGLSLFIAYSLERNRRALARKRHQLAAQYEVADRERKKAEALARDLDAYAHTVAHDLRNPIHLIAGYADLLSSEFDEHLEDDAQVLLSRITKGCAKMDQITTELLQLACVRKRREIAGEALDMPDIIRQARERVSILIEEAGAELRVPDDWPPALGHAPWVEEVWANYLSNAIKYGGSPPRVELGAESVDEETVHFWVRDNGAGFDPDHASRLFEEFSPVRANGAEGHGLGLSIVKRIVERLGGEVRVTSHIGVGSTFGFTLPAEAREA